MKTFKTEQSIRTLVDEQLKNLDWNLTAGKGCNVFQEQPRTVEERKKLKGKRPDYVLYAKNSARKEPIIIIETKKPGANLDEAIKQGDEYAEALGAPIVFATDGIYYKTLHVKKHKPLFLNGEEVDELFRELEAIKFLEDNEVDTISKEVIYDRKRLIKIFEDSNDLLRDEGSRAGIERFGEFSNILFLKLIGELEDLKEKKGDTTMLDKHLRWSSWKNKTGQDLLLHINKIVLPEIGESYKDKDIFTPLTIKSPNTLKKIIDKLDPLNLINIDSDIKGDSFEYFLKQSTATKNDLGEYFTPRHIVKVMVKLLNPQIGETVYDPFCGTGGTLIESFKHISHNMARTEVNWNQLKEKTLFGNEITTTARITKMNMILIGDGHSGIQQQNSLKNPVDDKYDIVITNMPYSQKTEYGAYYDLPSTNGDSVCIQHCIKAIDKASEKGRMALVVPEGFLFRKDLQKTREYLLDRCTLKSVISLPQGVFLPYTGVKTNILYCTNIKKKKKQEKVWYFDVKNDGYSLDSHRKKLEGKTDLQQFLEYRDPKNEDEKGALKVGFSQIKMEDIRENDLVLVGSRYKKMFDYGNVEWEVLKISDIATIGSGNSAPQEQKFFKEGEYPFFRTSDVAISHTTTNLLKSRDKLNKKGIKNLKLIPRGTILIPKSGASTFLNHRAILGVDGFVSSHLATILVDKSKVLSRFLFYLLCHVDSKDLTVDQNYPSLNLSEISNLRVPIPPLEIQKQIVEELDGYRKVVDGAKMVIENYKPNIEIKEEWKRVKLGDRKRFEIQSGGTPDSRNKDYWSGNINWITLADLPSADFVTEISTSKRKITKKGLNESSAKLLPKGTIVVSSRATIGRIGVVMNQLATNQGFKNIIIKDKENINSNFVAFILTKLVGHMNCMASGGTFKEISKKSFEQLEVILPDIDVQNNLTEIIQSEQTLINSNKKIIRIFERKIKNKLDSVWGK